MENKPIIESFKGCWRWGVGIKGIKGFLKPCFESKPAQFTVETTCLFPVIPVRSCLFLFVPKLTHWRGSFSVVPAGDDFIHN